MSPRRDLALFAASLALQGGIVVAVSLSARAGAAPSVIVAGLSLCFVPYLGVLRFSPAVVESRTICRVALIAGLLFGGLWVLAPPALSDDLYRYLWEGRLWIEGYNPYRLAPDDPALEVLRDPLWAKINNRALTSIYPPLSQLLFVVVAGLGAEVWKWKLMVLLGHLCSAAALSRVARSPRAGLALALNPLLLSEAALNGHFDILCGTALLLLAYSLAQHRFAGAALAACAAVALKLVGLISLPFLARRPRAWLAAALGSVLMLLPLIVSRGPTDPSSGLGQFASRWRGNESIFALLDWTSTRLFDSPPASLVARAMAVGILLLVCALILRRRLPPLSAIRALTWAVLLLSPQVHPWYLAWLLPLELAAGASAGLVWSALILCAYVPLDRWVTQGVWHMPVELQVAEYALLALALVLDPRRPSFEQDPSDELFSK